MWDLIQSNKRKSAALIVLLAAVLLALGYAIGFYLAPGDGGLLGAAAALAIWAVMMATTIGGGESILLSSSGAREVDHNSAPQLFNIVEEMKIASGLPAMPRVFIIDSDVPNAFAVGLNPQRAAVAVTTGLLSRLNRDELQGVIAHELGHIANRDTLFMTLAGVTVGAVILLADLFLRGLRYGGGRNRRSSSRNGGGQGAAIMAVVAIILAILAPLLAQILYFACSRRREYLADASAAQFTRYPEGLASALEKITGYQGERLQVSRAVAPMMTVNPLAAAGSATSVFSTHPATADRIRVLRSMGGASFAAYDQAFRSLHKNRGVIAAASLRGVQEAGVRAPAAGPAQTPAGQMRAAKDVLHRLNQLAVLSCPCGLNIKLPPSFNRASLNCPRCGSSLPVPPELLAAAAAIQAASTSTRKATPT